jgi:DUF4097 and DUF4098 domain-containing protein YvlB
MKRIPALTGLTICACALLSAQDYSGNRVVVPGRNGSHARTVDASLISGDLTVQTGSGNDVIVDANGGKVENRGRSNTPPGMHRLDMPWNGGVQVEEEGDTIHVTAAPKGVDTLSITVPPNTSLKLNCVHGDITVRGVHGEIDAQSTHGDITMTNIGGTVVANSTHGTMKISMDRVEPSKPLSFSSVSGDIDVTLPADLKANVKFKVTKGEIWSDFDIRLTGTPSTGGRRGMYQVDMDRTMNGAINGGGVEMSFFAVSGKITIHKR